MERARVDVQSSVSIEANESKVVLGANALIKIFKLNKLKTN